jgi:hypothetical protein
MYAQGAKQTKLNVKNELNTKCSFYLLNIYVIINFSSDKKYVRKKEREQHLPGYCL